jgi:hypothetical protein
MTLKSYLWGMRIIAFFSLTALGIVIFYLDPEKSGFVGHALFYATLFLSLAAFFILFLTWIRRKIGDEDSSFVYLGMGFRQGALLSVLAVILLALQSFRILTWWDGLMVVAAIFLVELYFLTR